MDNPAEASYQYQNRRGVLPISWTDFHSLCKGLALAVAPWRPEVILGIARAGLYPATLLSHLLGCELYPIRLTRRETDVVVRAHPLWLVRPPAAVAGRRVLIVDEICESGETLRMAADGALTLGAAGARAAVLYAHSSGRDAADYLGLISDALIVNPWDRELLRGGRFIPHPEYVVALAMQGAGGEVALLVGPEGVKAAKEPRPR